MWHAEEEEADAKAKEDQAKARAALEDEEEKEEKEKEEKSEQKGKVRIRLKSKEYLLTIYRDPALSRGKVASELRSKCTPKACFFGIEVSIKRILIDFIYFIGLGS